MARRPDLPPAVAERARRHRARLDARGLRVTDGDELPDRLDDVDAATTGVLLVAALPDRERMLRQSLEQLRERLAPGVPVRIVQQSRPLERSAVRALAERARGRAPAGRDLCDVPAVIRASGFTIGSIERFEVESAADPYALWIDVVALDLTERASEPEG